MKKIIIFVSLITYISVGLMQANNYVWIHGLNDNSNCWSIYNQAFTSGIGTTVGYTCDYTIPQIANKLCITPYYNLTTAQNTILIGHSLGGLVAREIEAKHNGNIKGIITIGTPHQGAPIEAQLANGGVKQIAQKVTDKIVGCISSTLGCITGGIFSAPVGYTTWFGAQTLVDLFVGPALDKAMASTSFGTEPCEIDMQVGSNYMNTIATRKVNVPILCFAAEEGRWALARMAYCSIDDNQTLLRTNGDVNADGTFDQAGYNIMQSAVDVSYVMGGVHAGLTAAFAVAGFADPYLWYLGGLNAVASYNWFSTADYLNNGLDYDHGVLVGNCGYEQRTYCYTVVGYSTDPVLQAGQERVVRPSEDLVPNTVCTTSTVAIPVGNDGIVSTYTQYLNTNKGSNVIIPSATIKGVNHMEEFNHPNTRKAFDDVLNGRSYRPEIFQK